MDPNAVLRKLRALSELIITGMAEGDYEYLEDLAEELAESVMALDGWIMKGGFLPEDWESSSTTRSLV